MMAYIHKPLPELPKDSNDIYIRLLKLPPGDKSGPISCSLIEVPLSQAAEFEALSYCWGTSRGEILITNDENGEGLRLGVPGSLIHFLYRTRAHKDRKTRILWVDSVCIDQTDNPNNTEKNYQVAHMKDIYVKAMRTLIWLGPAADRSEAALNYAHGLTKKMRHETRLEGKQPCDPEKHEYSEDMSHIKVKVGHPDLDALFAVLDRPYFERAWIVQEVVVSREAYVVVGDSSLEWVWFLSAYFYLMERNTWIFEYYPSHRLGLLFNLRVSGHAWEQKASLEWYRLLARHRECRSGDPRDKIFAFWGLMCKDEFKRMGVKPEYREKIEGVYWKLATAALLKGDVEILSVPRIVLEDTGVKHDSVDPESKSTHEFRALDIPSWVPDWRRTQNTPYSLLRFESVWSTWKPPYAASSNSSFPDPFGRFQLPASGADLPTELRLRGYTVARIMHLTPRPWKVVTQPAKHTFRTQALTLQFNQQQVYEWEQIMFHQRSSQQIYAPTGETRHEAAYRTLTAGMLLNGSEEQTKTAIDAFEGRQRFLRLYSTLGLQRFLVLYMIVVVMGRILLYFGIKNPEWTFRRLVTAMSNRKGAGLVSEDGRTLFLGLVPGLCEVGDVVVLCKGVKVPLVLREKKVAGEKGGRWELLGDAYVHGLMKGEMWEEGLCANIRIV